MKNIFKFIWDVILFIWQLPQNLVGLILRLFYPGSEKKEVAGVPVLYNKNFPGGISLGCTVIVCKDDDMYVLHGYVHRIQSILLGLFYLLVIGLLSFI